MMNCRYASERLDDYVDGALPPSAARLVEEHTGECTACQTKLAALEALRRQLSGLSTAVPPAAGLERMLRAAVRAPTGIGPGGQVSATPAYCILCVDDEPQVLRALERQLGRRYEVLTTTSGAEALRLLEGDKPVAVIISDMRMPRMDGAMFLACARRLAPEATRLLLTGHSDAEAAARAVNDGGIHRLLTKPCKPEELNRAIDQGIEEYRAARLTRSTLIRQLEASLDSQSPWSGRIDPEREPSETRSVLDDHALVAELPDAISREALELQYQPVVDVVRRRLTAFEALPTWNHPVFGRVSAEELMPLAAESGSILDLDAWVLERACREARQLLGPHCRRLAIHMSHETLHRRGFAAQLKRALLANRLSPDEIELELPDSVFRQDAKIVAPVLQDLRSRGHRIALDGLATCCSSLSSWHHLPIDTLRISRSCVHEDKPRSVGVLTSALAFGQSLGLEVVIDGVHTDQALRWLLDCGASIVQGSALAPPEALEAVATWVRTFYFGAAPEDRSIRVLRR